MNGIGLGGDDEAEQQPTLAASQQRERGKSITIATVQEIPTCGTGEANELIGLLFEKSKKK